MQHSKFVLCYDCHITISYSLLNAGCKLGCRQSFRLLPNKRNVNYKEKVVITIEYINYPAFQAHRQIVLHTMHLTVVTSNVHLQKSNNYISAYNHDTFLYILRPTSRLVPQQTKS